jgi:hypothetical protein
MEMTRWRRQDAGGGEDVDEGRGKRIIEGEGEKMRRR